MEIHDSTRVVTHGVPLKKEEDDPCEDDSGPIKDFTKFNKVEWTPIHVKADEIKNEDSTKSNQVKKSEEMNDTVDHASTPIRTSTSFHNHRPKPSFRKDVLLKSVQKKKQASLQTDVISLLSEDSKYVLQDHIETLPSVASLHERLGEALQMKWPIFQQISRELHPFISKANESRQMRLPSLHTCLITKLIKDCSLSRSDYDLAIAILPLTQFPKKCPELLWKIGSDLLQRKGQSDYSIFMNMMKLLQYHGQHTNIYMCHGIQSMANSSNNVHEVHQEFSGLISTDKFSDDPYVKIFYGLLEYTMWREEKKKWELNKSSMVDQKHSLGWGGNDELEEEEDELSTSANADNDEPQKMTFYGKRSLSYFHCVIERSGVWDLILPKYIELVSHYEDDTKVWRALETHAQNNPENPMSHVCQLQWMSLKGGFETEEMLSVYRKLFSIDPTNPLLKSFCLVLNKENYVNELFDILMRRLSCTECFDSLFDWNVLLDLLKSSDGEYVREKFLNFLKHEVTWKNAHFSLRTDVRYLQVINDQVRGIKSEIRELIKLDNDLKPNLSTPFSTNIKETQLASNNHHIKISRLNQDDEFDGEDEEMQEVKYKWLFCYDDVSSPELICESESESSINEGESSSDSESEDSDAYHGNLSEEFPVSVSVSLRHSDDIDKLDGLMLLFDDEQPITVQGSCEDLDEEDESLPSSIAVNLFTPVSEEQKRQLDEKFPKVQRKQTPLLERTSSVKGRTSKEQVLKTNKTINKSNMSEYSVRNQRACKNKRIVATTSRKRSQSSVSSVSSTTTTSSDTDDDDWRERKCRRSNAGVFSERVTRSQIKAKKNAYKENVDESSVNQISLTDGYEQQPAVSTASTRKRKLSEDEVAGSQTSKRSRKDLNDIFNTVKDH